MEIAQRNPYKNKMRVNQELENNWYAEPSNFQERPQPQKKKVTVMY